MRLMLIILGGIMAALALIILVVGCLATGSTRHSVYRAWKARVGGRLSCAIVILHSITDRVLIDPNPPLSVLIVPRFVVHFVLRLDWYLSVLDHGNPYLYALLGHVR